MRMLAEDWTHAPCTLSGGLNMFQVSTHPTYVGVSIVMGVPPNGWFIRENPTEMDDPGVPLFQETSM